MVAFRLKCLGVRMHANITFCTFGWGPVMWIFIWMTSVTRVQHITFCFALFLYDTAVTLCNDSNNSNTNDSDYDNGNDNVICVISHICSVYK